MASNENKKEKLIEMKNLKKYFPMKKRQVLKAVENVTMDIYKGEILSLVGESGSGKTTLGRTVSRLYAKTNGDILFNGKPVEEYGRKEFTKKVQMIFQDPQASLNPRMTVGDIIAEGIDLHKLASSKQERMEKVYKLLEIVGLNREHASRFPHEFSGGQRQRIGIARALAVDPEVLVCDEPISALDVSIQAQVVNLLKDLQRERNLTLLFIAHDLSMVKYISDRVAVMYRGKVVELGTPEAVYGDPVHSYTKSLISAVPIADPDYKKTKKIDMDESYLRSPMGDVSEIEVIPEFVCDIGTKKGEKVDYMIMKDGEPILVIECKHWKENADAHNSQLHRYYHVSKARFGILTNGIIYNFYTDLEKPNIMDEKPFLTINLDDLKDSSIKVLEKYNLSSENIKYYINPTGRFVIGGPHGDTGLTGRKIIVDTYGGYFRHGGGAFSGKDPSKVDRSAAYAARWVAKNIVAAELADKCEIQLSYAIGVPKPVSIKVDTFGTSKVDEEKISEAVSKVFDLSPRGIEKALELREGKFKYQDLAAFGHIGRTDIDTPWERLNKVDELKKSIN